MICVVSNFRVCQNNHSLVWFSNNDNFTAAFQNIDSDSIIIINIAYTCLSVCNKHVFCLRYDFISALVCKTYLIIVKKIWLVFEDVLYQVLTSKKS